MKNVILSMLLGCAVCGSAFADSDGDHSARPRPEFDQLQQRHPALMVTRDGITTTSFGRFGFVDLDEQPSVEPLGSDSIER